MLAAFDFVRLLSCAIVLSADWSEERRDEPLELSGNSALPTSLGGMLVLVYSYSVCMAA